MLRTAVFDTTGRAGEQLRARRRRRDHGVLDDGHASARGTSRSAARSKSRALTIPYREGMTLRDAVLLAGGLQEGALLTEAEIARLPENRAAGVTADHDDGPARLELICSSAGRTGEYRRPPGIMVPDGSRAGRRLLRPYDAVTIKWQPDWQLQQTSR